jgi:diguanylate cyclase
MVAYSQGAPTAAPPTPTPAARGRSAIWIAYGLISLALTVYLALLVFGGSQYEELLEDWIVTGFEIVVSGMCIARGIMRRRGRLMALTLGASLLAWSLGDLALTAESIGGVTPPTPSLADAFYLAFFPLAYVAVVLFMRGDTRRLSTPSWLDGTIAGLGAAAVCAAFAFNTLEHAAGGSPLEVATNLAYPIGDLLLLFLVVGGTAMLSGRNKAPWLLLATGVAINVAGDTLNLFGSSVGATRAGSVVNTMAWPTAILLMSMAVWVRPGHSDPFAPQKPPGFLLPGLAAASALTILVVGTLDEMSKVAIGLAAATLIVVGVRLARSAQSLRSLTQKRYRQSVTDDLTGLSNRRYLFATLEAYFADEESAPTPERSLAFLFVDLNRFKELNDSFGHSAGDEVLKQLGARLNASLRDSDALIRLGGDEFAVVLMDADGDYATMVAERLTASLEDPFVLEAVSPHISASIGIALAPANATDTAGLVWCADVAMYRAKGEGSPFALYEHEEDFEGSGNGLRLAEELRAAIDTDQLVLHYQPQRDLCSDQILTVEALLRWPHPRLGLVPPLKFLPVAEEAGLMRALTTWVLEQALTQCAAWREDGHQISVAVNVSPTNLLDTGFTDQVAKLLERNGLPADALVLELTETSIITEFERCRLVIQKLRDLGVVVSVDDFGSGFTSLAYLSSLAVGELKLDRTFITRMATGEVERGTQLVRATIELGHALGLRIVAEGVEDDATLALLSDFGCDLAQGYLIEKPKPAEELTFERRASESVAAPAAPDESARSRTRPAPPRGLLGRNAVREAL